MEGTSMLKSSGNATILPPSYNVCSSPADKTLMFNLTA